MMGKVSKIRITLSRIKSFLTHPKEFRIFRRYSSYTLFGYPAYIQNLLLLSKLKVEGCIVECGTWRGGMIAGWAHLLGNNREYYLFDSFEGLPDATEKDGVAAKQYQEESKKNIGIGWNNCAAEMSFADSAMKKAGIKTYHLIKGWFDRTLPKFDKSRKIALLHLDGDWYDSIMVSLENLYDSVVDGGIIIIDDYTNWDGCSRAVHDFFSKRNIPAHIQQFNNQITYLIKTPEKSVKSLAIIG